MVEYYKDLLKPIKGLNKEAKQVLQNENWESMRASIETLLVQDMGLGDIMTG